MQATFGAVAIYMDSKTRPARSYEAAVSVRHIPGGNNAFIDIGGIRPGTLSVTLLFPTEAAFTSLLSLLGTQAALMSDVYSGQAILTRLGRDEVYAAGESTGSAEFVLL
jgi:hypothetical protein